MTNSRTPKLTVALTGASGYLGQAVKAIQAIRVDQELLMIGRVISEIRADRVILAHGALQAASESELASANIHFTAEVLEQVRYGSAVVHASSRMAGLAEDRYGMSKRRAEHMIAAAVRRSLSLRFWVLAGPSPAGVGGSWLARVIRSALYYELVRIPFDNRAVGVVDVRQAAEALIRLPAPSSPQVLQVAPDVMTTDRMAEVVRTQVECASGVSAKIERHVMPDSPRPIVPDYTEWRSACAHAHVEHIDFERTVRDTVLALVTDERAQPPTVGKGRAC